MACNDLILACGIHETLISPENNFLIKQKDSKYNSESFENENEQFIAPLGRYHKYKVETAFEQTALQRSNRLA